MIVCKCKQCEKTYRVKESLAGRVFKCKKCGKRVTVPSPEDSLDESGDEEDVDESETEESTGEEEEQPAPPPRKKGKKADTPPPADKAKGKPAKAAKKAGKQKAAAEEPAAEEEQEEPAAGKGKAGKAKKKGGGPKKPISALLRRAKPGIIEQRKHEDEGGGQKKLLLLGGAGGAAVLLIVILALAFGGGGGEKELSVREKNFFLELDSAIKAGATRRAEGQFLYAIDDYTKAVAYLEKPTYPLERCPEKHTAVREADVAKLKQDLAELESFDELLNKVKAGDDAALDQAVERSKNGEEYQRLCALLILMQQPEEERVYAAVGELAKAGGKLQEKAVEQLKAKLRCKQAIPYLAADIEAGKDEEQAIRALMQIAEPESAAILAKMLVKHAAEVPLTRDILQEMMAFGQNGKLDRSCLADLKSFAQQTGNDQLRKHAEELIGTLEGDKERRARDDED